MRPASLPKQPSDVLKIPDTEMPDVIHGLMAQRALSSLMQGIHREMRSHDPKLREQAKAALDRLGFPE